MYDAGRGATTFVGSLPPLAEPPASANPLPHFMAMASALVVSDDSVSMVTEACATEKPVCAVACSRPTHAEGARAAARRLCGRDPANKLAWGLERLEAEQAVLWVRGEGVPWAQRPLLPLPASTFTHTHTSTGGRKEGDAAESLSARVAMALEEVRSGPRRPTGPLDDLAAVASRVRALCEG